MYIYLAAGNGNCIRTQTIFSEYPSFMVHKFSAVSGRASRHSWKCFGLCFWMLPNMIWGSFPRESRHECAPKL
jgi:hypothetical protein